LFSARSKIPFRLLPGPHHYACVGRPNGLAPAQDEQDRISYHSLFSIESL
jgi:hypothetical protein